MAKLSAITATNVTWQEAAAPSTPASTKWILYFKTDGLYYKDDAGVETGPLSAGGGASTFVGCKVYYTTTASINNTTDTKLAFDTEIFDTDAFHDNASNNSRITIPSGKAGYYALGAQISWDTNTSGQRNMRFMLNGSTDIRGAHQQVPPNSTGLIYEIHAIASLSVADYVEVNVWQNSGGARTVGSATTANQNTFWAYRIGT